MKRILFLLCSLSSLLKGQSLLKSDSVKYKELGGYYVNAGFGFWDPKLLTTDELLRLYPQFDKDFFKDYKTGFNYSNGNLIQGPFYIAAGATLFNVFTEKIRRKKNLQTNMELFYYHSPEASVSFEKVTWKRVDTLTSSSPSISPYYRDSVSIRNYSFTYVSDYIGYGMNETFGTNFNRFISVYAGPGFSFRYSLNPRIIETTESFQYLGMSQNPNKNYDSLSNYSSSNTHKIATIRHVSASYAFNLYLTGGINARIFRTKKSQMLFNFNFRLGAGWTRFRTLRETYPAGVATINFGLRYTFL